MAKNKLLKRLLSGFLSAACVLSGTAFAGTALLDQSNVTADAATTASSSAAPFSWDNATVYFLLTDRFNNGDTSNDHSYGRGLTQSGSVANYDQYGAFQGGDFAGITQKINAGYFDDLGVNAIWLSAPYEQIHGYCVGSDGDSFAHYSYHGYYVLDYTESDKNFGTKEEFQTLVDTAHEHGIRIVMDIVMNHAGYQTLLDMSECGFGPLKSGWESFYYSHQNINNSTYHGFIGYDSSDAASWANWWGPDWIRCGLPGYTKGSGDIEGCLAALPDFKTGPDTQVGLPAFLKNKWQREGTYSTKAAKYGSSHSVKDYISTWLAEWVREYGVDGFRCDTAKHVELASWKLLKEKCVTALREWKAANPSKKLDDLDFWMTGECFGHKAVKSNYYTDGGFDSMINFEFAPAVNSSNIPAASNVEGYYSGYASSINNDPSFNALSYLASHDTTLIKGDRNYAGSFLMMLPGGIQIYYGDETNRPLINSSFADKDPGAGHQFRSFMNWDSMDRGVLSHWQKLGQFRNNHLSIGAGQHKQLSAYSSSSGYTFARTYSSSDYDDTTVVTLFAPANTSLTIDVSSVWADGTEITNFYDETTCRVSGGKVTFNTGANGTILMQEPAGKKGRVVVNHVNQDTGKTIQTVTMSGIIGESYTTSPTTLEGYTVSRVSGSTSGVYSETEATVTYYYTFDSSNYGTVVTKYVDASSGAELADSKTAAGRIGASYTTEAANIKNYELDSVPSNATGTIKSGTTEVVYKYNYVEPTNIIVHYYNKNNWSSVGMYSYDKRGTTVKEFNGKWPGSAMEAEGSNWYVGEAESEWALVILNNGAGTAQEPSGGTQAKGYECTGEVWIKDGNLYPTGKVNVRYVDTTGKVLASEVLKGMADGTNTYSTSAKTFTGYTLSSTPANASGVYTEGTTVVNYVYASDAAELVNNTTVSRTSITVGDIVTVTGAASGGTAPYTYQFYYKRSTASSWTGFGSNGTGKFQPGSAGTFTIRTYAKDSAGGSKVKDFTITATAPSSELVNKTTVSKTNFTVGDIITVTGAASGGTAPYTYQFYYKRSTASSWTKFGSAASGRFQPGSAGTFTIRTYAKDSAGGSKVKDFTVTATAGALANKTTVSKTSFSVGETITVTGAGSGGTAPYTYQFYYKRSTASSWTRFGSGNKGNFKPGSAGTFTLRTYVKDSAGKSVVKDFTVTATAGELVNNTTVSATNFKVGTKVTVTGAASGGSGSYYYQFYYRRTPGGSWTRFGSGNTGGFQPGSAGTFIIRTYAKDTTGNAQVKDFYLTAT